MNVFQRPRRLQGLVLALLLTGHFTYAQQSVSIGTSTIKNNAVLYLVSQGKNQGLIIPVVSSRNSVSSPDAGMLVYDESDNKLYYRSNTSWVEVGVSSSTITLGGDISGAPAAATVSKLQGKTINASNPANGQILKFNSSTQTWELSSESGAPVYTAGTGITINANQVSVSNDGISTAQIAPNTITNSDLNKTTIPLSGFGAAAANVDLGNQKIINLATPTTNTDATTKAYVDAANATKLSSTVLTAAGDILYHDGTNITRLPRGTNGQVLQSTGTNIQWSNASSGFINPMTSQGDIIYGGAGGAATRLAPTAGFLKSTGATAPSWNSVNLNSTDVTSTLPVANGGTGATTAAAARTNLGLGTLSTSNSVNLNSTDVSGTLPLANGGTGATTATAARTNLGLGTLATLNAVGSTEITDGQIANADVATTAAIAGTKISPNFGAQNITTTGNVGIGTTSPSTNLNVVASTGTAAPVVVIQQQNAAGDASIGLSSATDNYSIGTNSAGSFKISNSTALGTNDHFEIRTGATDGSGVSKVFMDMGPRGQDGLHISSTSSWGTSLHLSNGTSTSTSSGYTMAVTGTGGPTGQAGDFAMLNGISKVMTIGYNAGGPNYAVVFPQFSSLFSTYEMRMGVNLGTSATPSYNLEVSGSAAKNTGTSWVNTSDLRLKKDISKYTDGLNVISRINPIWFRYNGKGGTKVGDLLVGVSAQEMKEIAPYTVSTFRAKYDENSTTEEEFYNFDYSAIGFALINAVKELDNRVKTLEEENAALRQQLQDSIPKASDASQLKAELEKQKVRTSELETQLAEIRQLLRAEAKK